MPLLKLDLNMIAIATFDLYKTPIRKAFSAFFNLSHNHAALFSREEDIRHIYGNVACLHNELFGDHFGG